MSHETQTTLLTKEEKVVEALRLARSLKGIPYAYGAQPRNPDSFGKLNGSMPPEFDCSSFIAFLLWNIGITFPEEVNTFEMAAGKDVETIDGFENAQPGDIFFFEGEVGRYNHSRLPGKYIGHVGIFAGDNIMIHSTHNAGFAGVVEHDLEPTTNPFYNREKIVIIKRYIH